MTCKDCLHYEACDRLADAKLGYSIMQVRTGVCKCFSDKSEWCHLAGKDSTMAYYVVEYGVFAQIVEEPIVGWGIKNGNQCVIDGCGDFYEIGGMVFLTKEEAQKELERRRKLEGKDRV